MLTEEKLSNVLRKVADDAEVTLHRDGYQWVAVVVSSSFEHQDDDERQSAVWELILDNLEVDEEPQVEFIFTNTPAEQKQAANA